MNKYGPPSPKGSMGTSMASIGYNPENRNHNLSLNTQTTINTQKSKQTNESIKVCIRVRPLLQNELHKEEIVYYPESKDPSLQSIRLADG